MLCLKEACLEDNEREAEFIYGLPADENGFTNPWYGLPYGEIKKYAVAEMIAYSQGKNLPVGYVPETFYFLWFKDEIVGQFRIRHFLCDSLREGAGHVGYFIEREFRGRGYAKQGLGLCLDFARDIIPEEEIHLRVNKDNIASLRVMLYHGGYIHHEDEGKYYVRIKK